MDTIVHSLSEAGIKHPFPIQEYAIPLALDGVDLIGQARTGTGKTLAFGVTALQQITLPNDEDFEDYKHYGSPQALVICPTRELAVQVAKEIDTAARGRNARVVTIYGGVGYEPQIEALKSGVDIVVGTPGRLLDLVGRGDLDLSHISILVLDEADEMLDLGFLPDVEKLVTETPDDRQTMLFSATMPAAILALARSNMKQPVNIRAEGSNASATVPETTQYVYQAHELDKPEVVGRILQANNVEKVMIFCKTKRAAQRLADDLIDRGFKATSIHGDLHQSARERALRKFRTSKVTVLVATDVAARGIDVTGVSHVINYECPEDAKVYVHRVGRTGRAGAKGIAISLIDWSDLVRWKVINSALELDFDEPAETYSTSPHLYSDLGIPEGTKGYLKGHNPLAPKKSRSRRSDSRTRTRSSSGRGRSSADRSRSDRTGDSSGKPQSDKPRRRRRRMRNGVPVERD